jgi:hypothetical protein
VLGTLEVDRFRGEVYIIFVLRTSWMAGPVVVWRGILVCEAENFGFGRPARVEQ